MAPVNLCAVDMYNYMDTMRYRLQHKEFGTEILRRYSYSLLLLLWLLQPN